LVHNRAKISGTTREDVSTFLLLPTTYIRRKSYYATHAIFILLTVTCTSTIQVLPESIVACPLQQWLRERATIFLYVHSLSCFFCVIA